MHAIFCMYLFLTRGSSVFAYSDNWGALSFSLDIFCDTKMTGDHNRLEPRRDTNMAETNFCGKNSKLVTSRENTLFYMCKLICI